MVGVGTGRPASHPKSTSTQLVTGYSSATMGVWFMAGDNGTAGMLSAAAESLTQHARQFAATDAGDVGCRQFPSGNWAAWIDQGCREAVRSDQRSVSIVDGVALVGESVLQASALDARFDPRSADGQFATAVVSDREVRCATDFVGRRPLYECRVGSSTVVSDSVPSLASLVGSRTVDLESAAAFLTYGAPRTGTLCPGVVRQPGGCEVVMKPGGDRAARPRPTFENRGDRIDYESLAQRCVEQLAAIAPEFDSISLALTGGFDFAGHPCVRRSGGGAAHVHHDRTGEDTEIARLVAAQCGYDHEVHEFAGLSESWEDIVIRLVRRSDGLITLSSLGNEVASLGTDLILGGVGGEVAKGYGVTPRALVPPRRNRVVDRVLGRHVSFDSTALTRDGRIQARRAGEEVVERMLAEGWPPGDLADLWVPFVRHGLVTGPTTRRDHPAVQYQPWMNRSMIAAAMAVPRFGAPEHERAQGPVASDPARSAEGPHGAGVASLGTRGCDRRQDHPPSPQRAARTRTAASTIRRGADRE